MHNHILEKSGVEHNVINCGKQDLVFIETELKVKARIDMNNKQKDEFNLQIRKLFFEFGVKAHNLVEKRFMISNISNCEISIKIKLDLKPIEEIKTIIKIN